MEGQEEKKEGASTGYGGTEKLMGAGWVPGRWVA
jgi:hypothetical protein